MHQGPLLVEIMSVTLGYIIDLIMKEVLVFLMAMHVVGTVQTGLGDRKGQKRDRLACNSDFYDNNSSIIKFIGGELYSIPHNAFFETSKWFMQKLYSGGEGSEAV